jgi:hypothetical protein
VPTGRTQATGGSQAPFGLLGGHRAGHLLGSLRLPIRAFRLGVGMCAFQLQRPQGGIGPLFLVFCAVALGESDV